jgi:SAM-dependent methyltransferase
MLGIWEKQSVNEMNEEEIRIAVRQGYAEIAKKGSSCCAPVSSCCGTADVARDIDNKMGYTEQELQTVPEAANLGLGCGNPIALASLKEGETVLDLGSGAGLDCFLAARRVGEKGKIIGVDMTPEMIEKARQNAKKGNYTNVEFRLGEIENLPIDDNSVDIVISNCVINLVPDKRRVFAETYRVLKPGGRIMISDLVLLKQLPEPVKDSVAAYVGCLSGAITKDNYLEAIEAAGFKEVKVREETSFSVDYMANDSTGAAILEDLNISKEDLKEVGRSIVSVRVYGLKP